MDADWLAKLHGILNGNLVFDEEGELEDYIRDEILEGAERDHWTVRMIESTIRGAGYKSSNA